MFKRLTENLFALMKRAQQQFAYPKLYYSYHFTTNKPKYITEIFSLEELDQKIEKAKRPVMINFYDAWDETCQAFNPKIQRLAQENGKYVYLKVELNEDEAVLMMMKYKLEIVPTIIVLKDDKVVQKLEKYPNDEELRTLMA